MRRLALAICLALAAPLAAAAAAPDSIALACAHYLDPAAGQLHGATTIVVADGRIQAVHPGPAQPDEAARTLALAGQTCLPGLIDVHTHLAFETSPTGYTDQFRWNPADYAVRATVHARRTLEAGFTTVRDLGDSGGIVVALRNAINAGVVPGPRIHAAGRPIGSTGGHADPTDGYRADLAGDPGPESGVVNGVTDAWKAVRLHYKEGDDVIKIMPSGGVLDESASADNPQLTLEEIQAVVAAAHDYGLRVAAHAHGAEAIRRAVLGGVDSIEHGTFMDEADMRLMKAHGTWYVPTIIAGKYVSEKAAVPGYYPPQVARKAREVGPRIQATAARAWKAGVKIAFGTDAAVYPHGENAKEFQYLVEAGLPPLTAIQAATTHAAELLGQSATLGVIAPGRAADIIAVPGDPLADITRLQHVSFVMKDGTIHKGGDPRP